MKRIIAGICLSLMGFATVACDDDQSASRVCVNQTTHQRVSDDQCGANADSSAFIWWYILYNQTVPPIGSRYSQGYSKPPSNYTIQKSVPRSGVKPYTYSGPKSNSGGGYKPNLNSGGTRPGSNSFKAPAPAPRPVAPPPAPRAF